MSDERGSTLPLVLGFFLVALLVVAGSVAAADAFVQHRSLQDVCDGAAAAAAATAVDLGRDGSLAGADTAAFTDVDDAVRRYLAHDPDRSAVRVDAQLDREGRTLTLSCEQTRRIAFGALFGRQDGVRHRVTSSARAPLS